MKILITGGAGFIGSRLVEYHSSVGDEVLIIDSFLEQVHGSKSDVSRKIDILKSMATVMRLDINDEIQFTNLITSFSPDICYHMAADTGTGQSKDEWLRYVKTNVMATCSLIAALDKVPNFRKLILPSSRSIYGEGPYTDGNVVYENLTRKHLDMESGDFDVHNNSGARLTPLKTLETSSFSPSSLYASTKLMQELILRQSKDRAWQYTILRFQNVYGAGQSLKNPYTGVLSIFSSQVLKGLSLNIFEDGEIYRDFVYVTDVVNACVLASNSDVANGLEINIGSGIATKMTDVASILIKKIGNGSQEFYISGDFREGDIKYACADIALAKIELNWQPKVSIEEGLGLLADWVKNAS
ncbi:NAD-dependent epimerase/dehydratase family protein [Enterovibrio norvegicus]|uniref:NAD-dependent epimerase/dehydratase family protein n=1 Tax=Enterovibrio norvegicus TaxID=188144 RepID=UPI0010BE4D47|nr:NAD-dependent epimerase/dehydratase family protein [Enterovibrio norvegicus]TKF30066.1 NAD-dependent epimerase/dehydratase family protein [Enterovibrio norvegicus]